jgi:hypothetical protein
MITFSLGKKRLFNLLFFLYYIVYATSPLIYTFPEQKNLKRSRESSPAAPIVKGIRLFLLELVIEKVVFSDEAEPDTGNTVIIKKKRALLPENAAARLLPFDMTSIPRDRYAPVPINGRTAGHVASHSTREGFSTEYAGHSPPLG